MAVGEGTTSFARGAPPQLDRLSLTVNGSALPSPKRLPPQGFWRRGYA